MNDDSIMLFEMKLEDFGDAIIDMDNNELRRHIHYARGLIEQLREELEELSYRVAEYEKHGSGIRH